MASSNNNNNANNEEDSGLGAVLEKDAVPAVSVGHVEQDKQATASAPVAGDKRTACQPGRDGTERTQDQKSGSDAPVSSEPSAPVTTEQQPTAPAPTAEESTPVASAQPTEELKAHPASPSNIEAEQESKSAIEPSTTEGLQTIKSSTVEAQEPEDAGMSLVVTLLLTTGARHPFKIDTRYLRKRSVDVPDCNPFQMSVYTLKELILREWRSEWETRPSSPSAIRLIFFGKLLEDKSPLSEYKFNHGAPNVVHMTVKPQEVMEEEDAKTAKSAHGRDRDANESSPGCRCVIL